MGCCKSPVESVVATNILKNHLAISNKVEDGHA